MFSYVVGLAALFLVLYNPVSDWLSGSPSVGLPPLRRTPRPQINEELLALEEPANQTGLECPPDAYSVHIYSVAPLVIYIENFLSAEEREHLLEISDPIFEPATITHDGGSSAEKDSTVRDSEVAVIPRTGPVRCVEARARALQGWREELWVERLRVQRYAPDGHYSHHYDWSSGRGGWGRVSSFMAWVGDGEGRLEGGGTEFPMLARRRDGRWCRFVECDDGGGGGGGDDGGQRGEFGDEGEEDGTVFKVVPGNAVYWENFIPDGTGRGYPQTWHAGLPVRKGVKVGLNIWSWGRID
ncbi:2OG-Fe(II) oxygenase family oxidoreductase [Pleurostoma richardsiae]|uniref:2OG-Fe(II) oxygenase family oxidoreductase n=1 Tax=Pleurostoma richardsiae TaxID=41990 RepID=A0AA38VIL7_9PEZI|nr:2OG-Fe(II) oxygenase family oxidoreductase [Pleurostoma richardsiae]